MIMDLLNDRQNFPLNHNKLSVLVMVLIHNDNDLVLELHHVVLDMELV